MAKPSQIIAFRRRSETPVAPVEIAVAPRAVEPSPTSASAPAVDLAGKPPVCFLIGSGRTGKTVVARYIIERSQAAGRQCVLAALDPVNRSLANYFSGVEQPETSDPAASAGFLRELLNFVVSGKYPAVIDLGGGDTTLGSVLHDMPNLEDVLAEAGLGTVAFYTLSPRVDDLAPFLSLGFQPKATAFVCNLGLTDRGPEAFRTSLEQPAVRAAIEAGAQTIWMPYLDSVVVDRVEAERMSFGSAPRKLGPFAAAQVRQWLLAMDRAFDAVSTWMP